MFDYTKVIEFYKINCNIHTTQIRELKTGWSEDIKLHLSTQEGDFLVRISMSEQIDKVLKNFKYAKSIYTEKILMSKPLRVDVLEQKYVLCLFSWIYGNELRQVMKQYSELEQYIIGTNAGKALKELHSNQVNIKTLSWRQIYGEKLKNKIEKYNNCGERYENDKIIFDYIYKNMHLLDTRPIIIQHGDFHDGNIVISPKKEIGIIDYNRMDIGDPWQEFDKTIWSLKYSYEYTRGLVDGYFDNNIPEIFFRLLALYVCVQQISNLSWAVKYNKRNQVNICKEQSRNLLLWYDNFNTIIPKWYKKGDVFNE